MPAVDCTPKSRVVVWPLNKSDMAKQPGEFISGVIEGFYGEPWKPAERVQLFHRMAAWGLNTYLYAPKDDLKHRALWREPYTAPEAAAMEDLIRAAEERGIRFVYALSPGLDIRYTNPVDEEALRRRFEQLLDLGVRHFALLFDDIPDRMHEEDLRRWASLAAAQCGISNKLVEWTRQRSPDGLAQ